MDLRLTFVVLATRTAPHGEIAHADEDDDGYE
jgi:hypothetical protein